MTCFENVLHIPQQFVIRFCMYRKVFDPISNRLSTLSTERGIADWKYAETFSAFVVSEPTRMFLKAQ